jgi:hypothetical protein
MWAILDQLREQHLTARYFLLHWRKSEIVTSNDAALLKLVCQARSSSSSVLALIRSSVSKPSVKKQKPEREDCELHRDATDGQLMSTDNESKPTITLTCSVSLPVAIGTAAVAPCARRNGRGRPTFLPDPRNRPQPQPDASPCAEHSDCGLASAVECF